MADERAPWLLRPIHGWFFLWEHIVPSMYRVVAVASAAAITATAITLASRIHWLVALLLATGVWIALAVAEEHDGRVVLDVDGEFLNLLRQHADPVLARAGFTFSSASGPARARGGRVDTFLYEVYFGAQGQECIDLWIHRDREPGGQLIVDVDGRPLERLLEPHREPQLAERVRHTGDAHDDVAALVAAFELVLPTERP